MRMKLKHLQNGEERAHGQVIETPMQKALKTRKGGRDYKQKQNKHNKDIQKEPQRKRCKSMKRDILGKERLKSLKNSLKITNVISES